jgi:Ca2+-binding EF-hand superfamily protein
MTSSIDSHEEKVINSIFNYYNKKGTKYLDYDEFSKLCSDYGLDLYEPHFIYIDEDGDNRLTYNEFKNWWLNKDKLRIFINDIDTIFYAYDLYEKCKKKYGELTYENFSNYILKEYSLKITDDEYRRLDKNSDNKLNFHEFCSWLKWF